jgi:outer membrane receptor protein involved in Fe transport
LFLLLGLPAHLLAQASATAGLDGVVTDPQGNAIAGATVTVLNTATNLPSTVATNTHGQYRILNVAPGTYTLTMEAVGFKVARVPSFKVNVGQTVTIDLQLEIGTLSEDIEVMPEGKLLQRSTVELSTVIQEKVIRELPLNGRNYTQLINLTPGANDLRINGQWPDGNNYQLDGANNTTVLGGQSALVPILDTIQEFGVQSHSGSAEFGGVMGATVTVVTKGGGNRLSGSAWEFLGKNTFNARNPFTESNLKEPPSFSQDQFGATVGGPVVIPGLYDGRNRTFFFAAYEGLRLSRDVVSFSRVPTERELRGDFANSTLARLIYDPATTRVGADGRLVRDPFPGNQIPVNRISPLAAGYLSLILPPPNYTDPAGGDFNRSDSFPSRTDSDRFSIRLDHRFGSRNDLSVRVSREDSVDFSHLNTALLTRRATRDRTHVSANWTHIFASNMLLESRYSYSDHPFRTLDDFPGGREGLLQLGFSQTKIDTYDIPLFWNIQPFPIPFLTGRYGTLTKDPFGLTESVSWVRGRHSVKVGFQLVRQKFTNIALGHRYDFSSGPTSDPQGPGSTGTPLASALLSLPDAISYYDGTYTLAFNNWGAYAQDEWKVRPNLTMALGLRYDYFPTPNFLEGMINDFDWHTGEWLIGAESLPPPCNVARVAPCAPGDGNLSSLPFGDKIRLADQPGIRHPIRDNFGPRVGVALSLNSRTVLRAGYGLYFDTASATAQEMQNTAGIWPSNFSAYAGYNGLASPLTTIEQIDRTALSPITEGAPWGTVTYFWDPHKKNAMSHQWNLEVQRELSPSFVVSAAYVGSLNRRQDLNVLANAARTPGPGSAAEVNTRRPFPYYGAATLYGTDLGVGTYNALQLRAERRLASGLQFLVAYTLSRSTDNGGDSWFAGNPQNTYDLDDSKGPSNNDRTHLLRISGMYELPFGRGKRWLSEGLASYILGKWQVNTILVAESGTPVVIVVPGDVANIGAGNIKAYARPDLVGDPQLSEPTANRWFNTAAFAIPNLAFGNAKRGLVRNPGYWSADVSMSKNVPIRQRATLQLRVEAFNVFNHTNLADPDANIRSPTFGRITNMRGAPRNVQLGVRLGF